MQLENKSAIVTGAASGVGRAIAQRYAEEGARVVVADINREGVDETVRNIRSGVGEAVPCLLDVSDPAQVDAMTRAVAAFLARCSH